MDKGNRQSSKGKRVGVSKRDQVYIGLDVHKRSVSAAVRVNGHEVKRWRMTGDVAAVIAALQPWRPGVRQVVYEAGPTGYSLARRLQREGWPARVIAPSKVLQERSPTTKSDSVDCGKLAELAEKRLLKAVTIPTLEEEASRQVVRRRDQVMRDRRRAMQRIRSFLLYHGLSEPAGLSNWTKASLSALRGLRLSAALRFCLDQLLDSLDHVNDQLTQIKRYLDQMSQSGRHAEAVRRLRTHPAVGPVTAMVFRLEVFRPERFVEAPQVGCYIGLSPLIHETDGHGRPGRRMPGGQAYLRGLLVEASWRWIGKDARAKHVYQRLVSNTGQASKAITAMARRLAMQLWAMLVHETDFRASG